MRTACENNYIGLNTWHGPRDKQVKNNYISLSIGIKPNYIDINPQYIDYDMKTICENNYISLNAWTRTHRQKAKITIQV